MSLPRLKDKANCNNIPTNRMRSFLGLPDHKVHPNCHLRCSPQQRNYSI
jgi:hypothetical protein